MAWMIGREVLRAGCVLGAALSLCGCPGDGGATPAADETTGTGGDDGVASTAITTIDPSGVPGSSSGDVDSSGGPGSSSGDEDTSGPGSSTSSSASDDTTAGEGASSESTDATTGPDVDAPQVVSVAPGDLQSGVAATAAIAVTFDEPMNPATITADVGSTACAGTIQLSLDDFATCIPMAAAPTSPTGITFSVTPAEALQSATTYRIRITTDATDLAGNPLAAEHTTPTGFITRYYHTITIDGVNDFLPEESFATSTDGHTAFVAWDATYMYFGFDSPDVASGNGQVWAVLYLGDQIGSNVGVLYDTQQPALPFLAHWHVRWRADNAYTGVLQFDGTDWTEPAWTIDPGDVYQSGTFVEIRVAAVDLGSPVYLDVALGLLREQALDEASWAAVPQDAYGDGYDPDFAQYFQFDRTASALPGSYVPLP